MRNQALLRMIWMSHELKKPTENDQDGIQHYHRNTEEQESSEATYSGSDSEYSEDMVSDDTNPQAEFVGINEAVRQEDEEDQDES